MKHIALILITTLFTISCAVGKKYSAPSTDQLTPQSFEQPASGRFNTAEPVADWWNRFEDDQLSELVTTALTHNHDMRVAVANLAAARALTGAVRRDRFPTVTATAGGSVQRISDRTQFGPLPDRSIEVYDTGFDASWELDLFGRVTNRINANQAQYQAAEADLRGVHVSIAAETAMAYINLRGAQYRLEVAVRNAANQQQTLDLITDLAEAGQGDQLNVARAEAQLELTQSTVPLIQGEINAVLNRLHVLTGGEFSLRESLTAYRPLPSIPAGVNVGEPMSLLARRPDIQAAERRLAGAFAVYNLRVADLYPAVSLTGNLGFLSTSFSDLPDASAVSAGFGPRIQWAAFNLGRVRDRIEAADADTDARLAQFQQTVLRALEETDTAMEHFVRAEEARARLIQAVRAGDEAVSLARLRFDAGIDNFLDLLDAERTLLASQERLAVSETQTAQRLIAVYKSLGGGWQAGAN